MSQFTPQKGPISSSCQCMQTALRVLEFLDNNKLSSTALDHALAIQKTAISQFLPLLDCQACSADPDFMMLLTVICDKILISFEFCSTGFQRWKPRPIQSCIHGNPSESKNGATQRFFLGVYEVDSEHEQRSLLRSLAIVQLQAFHRFLIKMEESTAPKNWPAHQFSLGSLMLRLQDTATGLCARERTHFD